MRVRVTTRRSRIVSAPDTPTTPISRNTVFAIIAAAGAPRRAKPSCGSRPARSRANICKTRLGVGISGYLSQIGSLVIDPVSPESAYDNPFFCPDPSRVPELEELMWKIRGEGDSVGAKVTVIARGVPPGLGEPVFDRLDADLAHAMMGINAVKAVEIGAGVASSAQRGSQHRDELTPTGFLSNNAGGILGGISSGQDVVVHVTFKPTSSIQVPGRDHRRRGQSGGGRDDRPARSVRGPARHADLRSDARHRAHRSLPAASRAERRREFLDPQHHRRW